MNAELQAHLEQNRKLEEKIDLAVCCAIFLPLVVAFAWSIWNLYATETGIPVAVFRGVVVLMVGHLGIQAGKWFLNRLTARFAPGFVIDATDPKIVKLYGSIRLDGTDMAEEKLLATRPGLQMYRGNAYKDFGCTLAAVTATQDFLQAKAELKSLLTTRP